MRIAAPLLLFLMAGNLHAQKNCPAPDHNATDSVGNGIPTPTQCPYVRLQGAFPPFV